MGSRDFVKQLDGYALTTAHILYHLPDYPRLLQSYVWQDYDLAPDFPVLVKFLDFWKTRLDGPLHSVRVVQKGVILPAEIRTADGVYTIH